MIALDHLSFWYPGRDAAALSDVSLRIDEGAFALVVGRTGSGKSTLLRAMNGLVPHFTGGHVEGRLRCGGLDPREHPPREFAGTVGVVGQDPLSGFVTDTVEEELAFGMEQLAVPHDAMRRRVEDMLDLMGIAHLRQRALGTLSGGEQQRVAIGAALVMAPPVLVLDEPTSALDPVAAEDALAAVLRLVDDLGVTVVAAEHRLERVVQYADRVVVVDGGRVVDGEPAAQMRSAPLAPPIVELGRLAGWDPLPLSIRDARRMASSLRRRLAGAAVPAASPSTASGAGLGARDLVVRYGAFEAVAGVDLDVSPGEVVGLMGRNGSGKSSLLWAIQGSGRRTSGQVDVDGQDPRAMSRRDAAGLVAMVPQEATDLLYHATIDAECAAADEARQAVAGTTKAMFVELADLATHGVGRAAADVIDGAAHPRDLSEGQRLALVLAVQLTAEPAVLLLDEPTRGLDYDAKHRLATFLRRLAVAGKAIVVATHDVEFVVQVAQRVVVMAEGAVVMDAPTAEALTSSMAFAPQVAKVLAPARWLTVDQVGRALGAKVGTHG